MNERDIFQAALDIADADQRQAYLAEACGADAALKTRVDELLAAHGAASQFLAQPAVASDEMPPTVMLPLRPNQSEKAALGDSEDEVSNRPDISFLSKPNKPGSLGRLGHYEILQVLGHGAFGIVFKAFDEKLHRVVAIKAMNPQIAATSPPRKRFLREARAVAAMKHENVVQIYSVEEQPLPYLAMEFVDGQTLQQKLDGAGPLDVPEILHLGRQMAAGLAAAHSKGLIHRDIKPGNILIEVGSEQKVKITDFGLARAADDATMTRTGMIAGTPMYMAPEQAMGHDLDHRADLFSLGSVLYQMTSGRPPFRGSGTLAVLKRVVDEAPRPIRQILPEVPQWLCTIIEKLHAKNPDERYQTAQEVADLFAHCQSELQATGNVRCVPIVGQTSGLLSDASPDTVEPLKPVSPTRNRLIAGAAIAAAVIGIALFVNRNSTEAPSKTASNPSTAGSAPQEVAVASVSTAKTVWHGWPADAPKPAIAPFDADQAKQYQEAWAKYLGVPVEYENSNGMKFRLIPPGEFMMGFTPEKQKQLLEGNGGLELDENYQKCIRSAAPQHQVILTQPFYLGTYEVRQVDYEKVMNSNPSHFASTGPGKEAVAGLDVSDHPVEKVMWNDAAEFCAKVSTLEKYKPFYFRAGDTVTSLDGTGYRLPTEAEWEWACRGGTTSQFWNGETAEDMLKGGWVDANSALRTHAVGELKANPFGLYDMHGNVGEWTQDWLDADYYPAFATQAAIDPQGPAKSTSMRVVRGGFAEGQDSLASSSYRQWVAVNAGPFPTIGFRVALTVGAVRQALKATAPAMAQSVAHYSQPTSDTKGWHGWPADAPEPAIAPFHAAQAKQYQESWAKYLGVPVEYENSVGMKFRLIPPGEFMMGSTPGEIDDALPIAGEDKQWQACIQSEGPLHQVVLTRPLYMGIHEVTQGQYQRATNSNPSKFTASGEWAEYVEGMDTVNFPVEGVSWQDASTFANLLSVKEAVKPSESTGGEDLLKANGYRLPTEAEWEFACRAGSTTPFYGGDQFEDLDRVGWWTDSAQDRTHAVGELQSNAFGLFDMHGNVWEWAADGWNPHAYSDKTAASAINPFYSTTQDIEHVIRGGNYSSNGLTCRSASRCTDANSYSATRIGMRLVLSVDAVRHLSNLGH